MQPNSVFATYLRSVIGRYQQANQLTLLFCRQLMTVTFLLLQPMLIFPLSVFAADKPIINFNHLSVEDGLSQSSVYQTLQDHNGLIWVATQDGLNKYDGRKFVHYRHKIGDLTSLSSNDIRVIFEDSQQRLWLGTNAGINRLDTNLNRFTRYWFEQPGDSVETNVITNIVEDPQGLLWIGTRDGVVRFDPQNQSHQTFKIASLSSKNTASFSSSQQKDHIRDLVLIDQQRLLLATNAGLKILNLDDLQISNFTSLNQVNLPSENIAQLLVDRQQNIWFGSVYHGLFRLNPNSNQLNHWFEPLNLPSLKDIRTLYQDKDDFIWFSNPGSGMFFLDPIQNEIFNYQHTDDDPTSLSHNFVFDIFQDISGLFWIGTWANGLNTFNPDSQSFNNMVSFGEDTLGNSQTSVWSIIQAKDGDYWFGTNEALIQYSPQSNRFKHFKHDPNDNSSLSSDRIWAVAQREDGLLWVGTFYEGLNLFDPQTGKVVKKYGTNFDQSKHLPFSVISIIQADNGEWWFSTRRKGLAKYLPETDSFQFYSIPLNNKAILRSDKIFSIFQDSQQQLWLGTELSGLQRFDRQTGQFQSFIHDPKNAQSILSNTVLSITEDHQGNLIIGTDKGLSVKQLDGQFKHFTVDNGLKNEVINGALLGCDDNIWVSTNYGVSSINLATDKVINYTKKNGVVNHEFNVSSFYNNSAPANNCQLMFGGNNGVVSFTPKKSFRSVPPKLIISDILKYYRPITTEQHPNEMSSLSFSFRDKVISLVFNLIEYNNVDEHQFFYRMTHEGEWFNLGNKNQIDLANPAYGTHTLQIKGRIGSGSWSNIKDIQLTITPPWWLSTPAFISYVLLTLLVIGYYLYWQQRKLKEHLLMAEKEREISEKLRRLDKLKDEFLANTSHELRTPLNAIIGLSEIILTSEQAVEPKQELNNLIKIIKDSGENLLVLVNDLLDYSAINEKQLRMKFSGVDLKAMVDSLVLELNLLNDKSLEIVSTISDDLPLVKADHQRLYQILLNLLNNAVKFTEHGTITVEATLLTDTVVVRIVDSGIGIPDDKLQSVFNRFEQVEGSTTRRFGGTGLGLAITKELVELHGGIIGVKSEVGRGTEFEVRLKIWQQSDV